MKNLKKSLQVVSLLAVVAAALISIAPKSSFAYIDATKYVPLAPIEGTCSGAGGTCAGNAPTNLSSYLTGMFRVGVVAAGILAFLVIVWGGFTYLSTDAITGKEEGRAYIGRAVGGLLLALASYVILYTINPSLVNLDLYFGSQVNTAPPTAAPSLADQLNQDYNQILQNINVSNAAVKQLQQQADQAQTTLDNARASGAITDSQYAAGEQQVRNLQTVAGAVGAYNATLAEFANIKNKADSAANRYDLTAVQQALISANSYAETTVGKLTDARNSAAGAGDTDNANTYTKWINDIQTQSNNVQSVIVEDVFKSKNYSSQRIWEGAMDIASLNGNQTLMDSLRQTCKSYAGTVGMDYATCTNYNPPTSSGQSSGGHP